MTDLSDIPMDTWQARFIGKHLETMPAEHLLGAYVLLAKFKAEVSDDERREIDVTLNRIMDLMREHQAMTGHAEEEL